MRVTPRISAGNIIGIILTIIILFAIFGNILVVVAIATDRNLQKVTNYFIVSLAVADLLVAALVMTFAVVNDIMGYWVFWKDFCSIWISFDIMCSTASILNLCSISLDRYLHIRYPLHYDQWVTSRRVIMAISVIWIISAAMSFIPIMLDLHQLGMARPTTPPDPNKYFMCLLKLSPYYAIISSLVSFYIPCLVMVWMYAKLFRYAQKQMKSIKKMTRYPGDTERNSKVSDHKAAITLGVIMGSFLLSWAPFFTINIVDAFCPTCIPAILFSILTWLGYFNSTLNPIIYSIFNTEFREAFKRVLRKAACTCTQLARQDSRRPIRFTHVPQTNAYGSTKGGMVSNGNGVPKEEITEV